MPSKSMFYSLRMLLESGQMAGNILIAGGQVFVFQVLSVRPHPHLCGFILPCTCWFGASLIRAPYSQDRPARINQFLWAAPWWEHCCQLEILQIRVPDWTSRSNTWYEVQEHCYIPIQHMKNRPLRELYIPAMSNLQWCSYKSHLYNTKVSGLLCPVISDAMSKVLIMLPTCFSFNLVPCLKLSDAVFWSPDNDFFFFFSSTKQKEILFMNWLGRYLNWVWENAIEWDYLNDTVRTSSLICLNVKLVELLYP